MKTIQFLGEEIASLGMGTWNMGVNESIYQQELEALRTGIEAGLTLIDTAEMYGDGLAEQLVGEAIKPYNREKLQIVSKVYPWNATKEKTRISLENSLKRLKTDYLDLYLLHWLEDVPLEETVEILETLKLEGKIKNWGVSNLDLPEMEKVVSLSPNCVTNQVLYHLGSRGIEFDLKPWMDNRQMVTMAYSPLAQNNEKLLNNAALLKLANKYQITIQQLMLAWVVHQPNTIAIPKSSKKEHVLANMKAMDIVLTKEDVAYIDNFFPSPTTKQPLAEI